MAPESTSQPPGTPTRHGKSRPNQILDAKISLLCKAWPLGLEPKTDHSPSKSKDTIENECLFLIKWCYHKDVLDGAIFKFKRRAETLYSGWISKPKADRGVVPASTRDMPKPVNDKERMELLECLIHILTAQKEAHPDHRPSSTPRSSRSVEARFSIAPIPIKLPVGTGAESKRTREELFSDVNPAKKAKARENNSFTKMLPPQTQKARPRLQEPNSSTRSANTSFASEASSVFSRPSFASSITNSTQNTEPDDELPPHKTQEIGTDFMEIQEDRNKSSDYGASSSFERALNTSFESEVGKDNRSEGHVDEELSQNLWDVGINENISTNSKVVVLDSKERDFLTGLEAIFPGFPACLRTASIYVIYEITRVFLHAGVPIQEFDAPISDSLNDYDTLWKFLKSLPNLEGQVLPERCGAEVWKFAVDDLHRGSNSVVFAGTLHLGTDSDPSFRLRLDPLKLDHSHRLGRRFGHDRFLEICMPSITDKKLPKSLSRLGLRGSEIFYDWLVDSEHCIFGRKWQPFFVKPKERKSSKKDTVKEIEAEAAFRVYLFATDGVDFLDSQTAAIAACHGTMSIPKLLNMVRPTEDNSWQKYLKLFSRTSLALSRNRDTVVLSGEQIRFQKQDILFNGEVMNDGAGRISLNLANQVRIKLGLTYLPSAFQGRLGEAKGLWIVDASRDIRDDWIEVYPSQQKWQRNSNADGSGISDDWSHRTFEVLKWSGPLKSADLNTQFLPLLVELANDPKAMKSSISKILQDGLASEVTTLKEAFEQPQALRKWVREVNPNTKDRLKYGAVHYRGGMPNSTEERLNVLLDAGFSPTGLSFVYEHAKQIFQGHCDDLQKRLNITVGKSTYAYMVPDFWGVLEPGEVYIDFSGFVDDATGFTGALVNGVDLLVARSPAHFLSDIQKVKSVVKAELMGLKDVIVFSTKGNPSLASKLSGGDYDGDIAWICWEEIIVDNFMTADVPKPIDLVKEGFLRKDSTTYGDLVKGCPNPTSKFLKHSLEFNMRQSMLGICTNFKEKVCYTQNSANTRETIYLSQLLSDLVDAPKQGFTFDEEAFKTFKHHLDVRAVMPRYISGELDNCRAEHILDHLIIVARTTIKKSQTQFWEGFAEPPRWDADVVLTYEVAKKHATADKEWDDLLKYMCKELITLKNKWSLHFDVGPKQKEKHAADFNSFVLECSDDFHAIRPNVDTPLTQALLLCSGVGNSDELSPWALLKASAFFAMYPKKWVSNAVWWIAGRQLLRLKADAGRISLPHVVAPHMFIIQRPDNAMIRRLVCDGNAAMLEDHGSIRNVEELEELYDD